MNVSNTIIYHRFPSLYYNRVLKLTFTLVLHNMLFAVAPSVALSATTTATQGSPLSLDCNPIGQPPPNVTWYKNDVRLVLNSRVSIDGEDRLVFSSVISADGGSYRCEASNSAGMDSANTTLTVRGRSIHACICMATI